MQARVVAIMVVFIVQIAFVGATSSNWKYEWEDKTATPLDQDTPTQTKQTNLHRADNTTTSEQQNTFNNPQNPTYRLPQISYDRVPKYHMKESHNQLYQAIYSNRSQDTTTSEQQNTFNNPQNPTYRLPQISYDQRPANQPQAITNRPYYLPQNQHNLNISQQNKSNNSQTHKSNNPFSGQSYPQSEQLDPVVADSLFVQPFTGKQKVQSVYPHSPSNPGNNFKFKPSYFKTNRNHNLKPSQGQLYDTPVEYIIQPENCPKQSPQSIEQQIRDAEDQTRRLGQDRRTVPNIYKHDQ
eukprot:1053402_1